MRLTLILAFMLCIQLSSGQIRIEPILQGRLDHVKKTLEREKVRSIVVNRTIYSTSNSDISGSISTDSVVYSKDGSYYRKIYFDDGGTWTTIYQDSILTVNGNKLDRLPDFLKSEELFYSIFRVTSYDSCANLKANHCECHIDDEKHDLFFDDELRLVKLKGRDFREFLEFEEIFGLSYPSRIKAFIDLENMTSDVKITSLTVLRDTD